jgi:hypothetical protein
VCSLPPSRRTPKGMSTAPSAAFAVKRPIIPNVSRLLESPNRCAKAWPAGPPLWAKAYIPILPVYHDWARRSRSAPFSSRSADKAQACGGLLPRRVIGHRE